MLEHAIAVPIRGSTSSRFSRGMPDASVAIARGLSDLLVVDLDRPRSLAGRSTAASPKAPSRRTQPAVERPASGR